jgi:hypothetical protein
MTIRRRMVAAVVATTLSATGLLALTAAPAAAATCGSGVPGDVNGDGYAEVAVAQGEGRKHQGVHVFYGQPSGFVVNAKGTARDDQFLTDQSLQDDGDALTSFGSVTRFGDFNDDGCADLAVGAEGGVGVFYGSRLGLQTVGSRRFDVGLLYGFNPAFGRSLAVADLDDDGVEDLAVGVPLLNIGAKNSAGAIAVLWGSKDGLNGSRLPSLVTADEPGIPGGSQDRDYLGLDLAAGDFNGDGRSELVTTRQNGTFVPTVQVLAYANGAFGAQATIGRATPGVPGEPTLDGFGDVLAVGDTNADGRDDLVVGAPDPDEQDGVGSVVVLYGSQSGLTASGSQEFRPGEAGVPATTDPETSFASAIAMGDLNADGKADLAIGAFYGVISGKTRAGSVTLLYGGTTGLSATGAQRLTEATPGIPGKVDEDEEFGCAVGMANLQSKTQSTLLVGACGEKVGKQRGAGMVYQLPVGPTGPQPAKATRISADTPGVKGSTGFFAGFGGSISEGDRA